MSDDADQPLPGLALFFPQRLAQVRQHEQLVRATALPEQAAADFPPADAAGKHGVDDARGLAGEAFREIEVAGSSTEQPFGRLAEKPRPCPIDELQLLALVEGEDRDVDLRHDLAQQGRGFERVEPLVPQRLDERVHFDHDLAERISPVRAARADREIAFAERREQVRQRLQGEHDALAQGEREAETERDDENGERPLDLGRVVTRPQEDQ